MFITKYSRDLTKSTGEFYLINEDKHSVNRKENTEQRLNKSTTQGTTIQDTEGTPEQYQRTQEILRQAPQNANNSDMVTKNTDFNILPEDSITHTSDNSNNYYVSDNAYNYYSEGSQLTDTQGKLTKSTSQEDITQSNPKKYQCNICDKPFINRNFLMRHLYNHDDQTEAAEGPYQCTECDKSFTQSDILVRHLSRTHFSRSHPI